jgi:murein DD-endopeptidase MepM/ murein hydrolase activator NlpD
MSDKRAVLLLVMGSLAVVLLRAGRLERERFDEAARAAAPSASVAPAPALEAPAGPPVQIAGVIESGDILAKALRRRGLSPTLTDRIVESLARIFDPRRARPGDVFRVVLDTEMSLLGFEYDRTTGESFRVEPLGAGLVASILPERFERRLLKREGTVRHSLYEAVRAAGGGAEEVAELSDVFAGSIDFFTECRAGDRFTYLVEAFTDGDRVRRLGRLLFAEYACGAREAGAAERAVTGIYFEPAGARGGYYAPDGASLQRAFLKSPLSYRRITSRFSRSRFHPVLKACRPHLGVDYGAPAGTPVSSVADGVVALAGWHGGMGKCVKIRHAGGVVTSYGHLSRIGLAIRTGRRVAQGDVIGHVGSTGLATGPHLHFDIERGGVLIDPLAFESPGGPPLAADQLLEFARARDALADLLVVLPSGVPTPGPAATTAATAAAPGPPRS